MDAITGDIIRFVYRTYNALGHGFLEAIYASALEHELRKAGHEVLSASRRR